VSENTGTPEHGAVMCLKWADDTIIAGYEDGTVLNWTGKSSEMLHLFQQPVTSVDFLLGNMAFASANGSVCLISKSDSKRVIKFPDGLSMVCINPNLSTVAIAAWDGTILIVPFKNARTDMIAEHRGAIRSISWLNETTLFAGSEDSRISVWNI
jgi:WD40 repeat protein